MTGVAIELPAAYGEVLLTGLIFAFECLIVGFICAGRARSKVFTKDFLEKNFGKEHKQAYGSDITAGGYPDSGSGYYANKLSYKDWCTMNNGQRAHMNFVEWVTSSLFFLLVAGLYCPCTATILGVGMIVGRMIYAIGYVSGGPNGRRIGAILNDLAVLGLFIMAVMYSVHLICPCGEKAPSADL